MNNKPNPKSFEAEESLLGAILLKGRISLLLSNKAN